MKFDLRKHLIQKMASLDRQLGVFKEYYQSLNDVQRNALANWVRLVSAPFPDGFDEFIKMQCEIGLDENREIGVEIEVRFNDVSAKVLPQHLRQAIAGWERSEGFAQALSFDYT
jgi:hypothetical protein